MAASDSERDFREKVAIVGIGYSRSPEFPGGFSRNSGVSVLTLAVRAAREACADAGIDPKELEGGVCYGINDTLSPQDVLRSLGCPEINYSSFLSGGGNYASMSVVQAAQAVYHGICKYAIVYRAMNGRTGVRMGQLGGGATGRVGGPAQFTSIYGLAGPPAMYALRARPWMDAYGVTSLDLANYCVNARDNAAKNPRATFRNPITVEDHQSSRMVVDPYHLLDCCLETDVGVAMVLTTADRARDLPKRPVLISAGMGGASPNAPSMDSGFVRIGPRLLEAAGIQRQDIDIFEPYDNFTDCPLRLIEDMGWCAMGESKDFILDGRIGLDGELPVSTHGGLMNEGYAHGLNNALEAVQQLRGEAEDLCPGWQSGQHTYDRSVCRQVRDPQIALHCGVMGAGGLVLKRG